MWKCISKKRKEFGEAFNISPHTWVLPDDYKDFIVEKEVHLLSITPLQNSKEDSIWILKPNARSCGVGIKLIGKHSYVPRKQYVKSH